MSSENVITNYVSYSGLKTGAFSSPDLVCSKNQRPDRTSRPAYMQRRSAEVPVLLEHWPQICQRRLQIVFRPHPFGQESGRAVQDQHQAVYREGA